MIDDEAPPGGWVVWSDEEDGRSVYAYRPDVFDGSTLSSACLPILYVTHGKRTRRPGQNPTDRTTAADWFVTLYLEPEVHVDDVHRFDARDDAVGFAFELARQFDAGEIDYRAAYHVPREEYFETLDELTDRDSTDE